MKAAKCVCPVCGEEVETFILPPAIMTFTGTRADDPGFAVETEAKRIFINHPPEGEKCPNSGKEYSS